MKVLSIKEPYASLIKEQVKFIETRSFKTKYRGELYIHASKSKVDLKDENITKVMKLLKDQNFDYGCIIAKCELVDCVYMDEEFVSKIKQNKTEYVCGKYTVGRYGWMLENIEELQEPIPAKGSLSIWNYE